MCKRGKPPVCIQVMGFLVSASNVTTVSIGITMYVVCMSASRDICDQAMAPSKVVRKRFNADKESKISVEANLIRKT